MSDDSGGSKEREREREREEIRGNLIQGTNDAADASAGNSAIVSRNLAAVGCELQCECDPAASPVPTTASSGSGGGRRKMRWQKRSF